MRADRQPTPRQVGITTVFSLCISGGSNIAVNKAAMLAEAVGRREKQAPSRSRSSAKLAC